MNKETRIQKIQEVIGRDDYHGEVEIPWKDELQLMKVYKIPLEYLVYNKYNGRILSRTKSLEIHGHTIDVETPEGHELIEKLLWESKEDKNKITLKDLERRGQQKVGIITRDGIIIDGNRRAMLLNKLNQYEYFKAVVLPVELADDPIEIQRLETSYQMGEDAKVDYNAIEKYLKTKDLLEKNITTQQIADWMSKEIKVVEEYNKTMRTMDEYLRYLEYDGIYTQLDEREDQFLTLTNWLDTYSKEEGSTKGFPGYRPEDVDDLKLISFDYIRAQYEGKEFRKIAQGQRKNHLFGDEEIWKSFRDEHFNFIRTVTQDEAPIDYECTDIESHLRDRDNRYRGRVEDFFEKNLKRHEERLGNRQAKDRPIELAEKAQVILTDIDEHQPTLKTPEVSRSLRAVIERSVVLLNKSDPGALLDEILTLIKSFKVESGMKNDEALIRRMADISSEAHHLKKELGG